MKIYVVFNNEFMEGIRGVFAKEEDAKKCIAANIKDYLIPGETKTLNDMFSICIEEHEVINSNDEHILQYDLKKLGIVK